jgi:threonine dehydratase
VSAIDQVWAERLAAAAAVIGRHLIPTPLVPVSLAGFEAPVFLKLESYQPTGSFKVRGGLAASAAYGQTGAGIVTASAGNHGLGLAHAASTLGVPATVFVPVTASTAKIDALRRYSIDLRLVGKGYDEAEAAALSFATETGGLFVSAYTDPHVIAGQATIVREVAVALPGPFRIVVPVGGGGLAAGTALGASPEVTVLGVESAQSRAVSASMAAGSVVEVPIGETIADGLAGNIVPDAMTPAILSRLGVDVIAVAEPSIATAVRTLALEHGVVAEGSAVVGIAAAQAGFISPDLPTVFVITGRNIAASRLAEMLVA